MELWKILTTLDERRQGATLIGRHSGEPKSSMKSLDTAAIASENGVAEIIAHLDKINLIDKVNQLDIDLAELLDWG